MLKAWYWGPIWGGIGSGIVVLVTSLIGPIDGFRNITVMAVGMSLGALIWSFVRLR